MREQRRDHYLAPATGADTERILDASIETLGTVRGLEWVGDAGITLHLLASLTAEAERRLPRAVADARDQEYSWAQIAISSASPAPAHGGATPVAPPTTAH